MVPHSDQGKMVRIELYKRHFQFKKWHGIETRWLITIKCHLRQKVTTSSSLCYQYTSPLFTRYSPLLCYISDIWYTYYISDTFIRYQNYISEVEYVFQTSYIYIYIYIYHMSNVCIRGWVCISDFRYMYHMSNYVLEVGYIFQTSDR